MVWFYPCFSDLNVKDASYLLLRELFHHKHWRIQGDDDSHCLILLPFFLWCCILPQEHSLVLPTRIPRSWPTCHLPWVATCQPSISASYPSSLLPPLSPLFHHLHQVTFSQRVSLPCDLGFIPVTQCLQSGSSAISDSRWVFITCPIDGTKCLSNTI